MQLLQQHIESLVFTAENGIAVDEIRSCLKTVYGWELEEAEIREHLAALQKKYDNDDFSFTLSEIGGGYQFLTKKSFHNTVHAYLQIKEKKKLSTAALETLAIIAYKQPVSKSEIEQIRGVNCDYSIQKLLEKDLIAIEGKSDGPGRPLIYGTSQNFMDHFGLKNVRDLPKLKDLRMQENEIGSPADHEDGEAAFDAATATSADAIAEHSPAGQEAEMPVEEPHTQGDPDPGENAG